MYTCTQTHIHMYNIYMYVYSYTREGNGTPLQHACLENPMVRRARWAAVHGVAKSQTWLSDFTFTFHVHALEKEMAIHSSVLAWRIPETGEPGGLPSLGSHRVGHDWSDLAAAAAAISCSPLIRLWTMRFKHKLLMQLPDYLLQGFVSLRSWFSPSHRLKCGWDEKPFSI